MDVEKVDGVEWTSSVEKKRVSSSGSSVTETTGLLFEIFVAVEKDSGLVLLGTSDFSVNCPVFLSTVDVSSLVLDVR